MKRLIFIRVLAMVFFLFTLTFARGDDNNELDQLNERLYNATNVDEKLKLLFEISKKITYSNFELAVEHAENGLKLATENDKSESIAKFNSQLGKLYLEASRKEEALEKLREGIRVAKKENLKEIEARTTINLGYYWYRLGDSTKTISNYKRGLNLYSELNDSDGIAQSYLKLGWGYDIYGNYEHAEKYFQKAVDMEGQITDSTLLMNILRGMGAFYANKSIEHQKAIQYFERALKLAELRGELYGIGRSYNALGFLYETLDDNETAKSFYFKGLEIFDELENKAEQCWLYIQIGKLYSDEKEFDLVINYLEKALSIVDDIDRSLSQKAEIQLAIGSTLIKKGQDYNKALEFLNSSLATAKNTDNKFQIINNELELGLCYNGMGNFSQGKKWCELALNKAQNHLLFAQDACNCLYVASQGLGDYKSALHYHKNFKILSDSLNQEKLSEQINNLAAKQAYEMKLAEFQKEQDISAVNMRIKSIAIISVVIFLALLIIALLYLSNVKKTAQKKQLQALSTVRSEMIANVSHDLRTPITVMSGYIETLLMRLGKIDLDNQEKYLKIIHGSAERLTQLIGQLFEYSKLEAKQIKPIKSPFQLEDLVKDTFSRYQILADKKDIKIKLCCSKNIPIVYADVILIERVIQNLMDNALKFTPNNGTISICLTNENDQVQVEIIDTGKGISKEKEKLIFERYEKSKSSNGAGLGLTIVKNILDMHGSQIKVNSILNQGTKFSFSVLVAGEQMMEGEKIAHSHPYICLED